jgi:cytidine deaminase
MPATPHTGNVPSLPGGWTFDRLHQAAEEARENAYAPYSGLAVGAALLARSGELFVGANLENGSYSLTICAERAAVAQAIARGVRDFTAIAVAGTSNRVETLPCCGACLQVLAEFDEGNLAVAFPDHGGLRVSRLSEMLPVRFSLRAGA